MAPNSPGKPGRSNSLHYVDDYDLSELPINFTVRTKWFSTQQLVNYLENAFFSQLNYGKKNLEATISLTKEAKAKYLAERSIWFASIDWQRFSSEILTNKDTLDALVDGYSSFAVTLCRYLLTYANSCSSAPVKTPFIGDLAHGQERPKHEAPSGSFGSCAFGSAAMSFSDSEDDEPPPKFKGKVRCAHKRAQPMSSNRYQAFSRPEVGNESDADDEDHSTVTKEEPTPLQPLRPMRIGDRPGSGLQRSSQDELPALSGADTTWGGIPQEEIIPQKDKRDPSTSSSRMRELAAPTGVG